MCVCLCLYLSVVHVVGGWVNVCVCLCVCVWVVCGVLIVVKAESQDKKFGENGMCQSLPTSIGTAANGL